MVSNFSEVLSFHLVWGCDPSLQYEADWIRFLLGDIVAKETQLSNTSNIAGFQDFNLPIILIESGLLLLSSNYTSADLQLLYKQRITRFKFLSSLNSVFLIHLSDEEGLDGDGWYSSLPVSTVIWRNFYHSRFSLYDLNVLNFPIGPRKPFLNYIHPAISVITSSERIYPWAFMGTLWPTGTRKLAVSIFLHSFPKGYYYGGSHFGQGLPLDQYQQILLNSIFSLSPQGDRHLDTFRLWEGLCCGCLPLIVDYNDSASSLISPNFPLPIFSNWSDVSEFVSMQENSPKHVDLLQSSVRDWWLDSVSNLQLRIRKSFSI